MSRLYGAPPGYVGFDQGGMLTTPVQANPFRVILFDEIEKADPRVFDIFLQILGDGRLTDSKGSVAYFSESFIIFTSNLGADEGTATGLDEIRDDAEKAKEHYTNAVEEFFRRTIGRPELLNRIGRDNIVVFNHIGSMDIARRILRHQLETIVKTFNERSDGDVTGPALEIEVEPCVEFLVGLDSERIKQYGGREIENLVNERVRDPLALAVLEAEVSGASGGILKASIASGGLTFAQQ